MLLVIGLCFVLVLLFLVLLYAYRMTRLLLAARQSEELARIACADYQARAQLWEERYRQEAILLQERTADCQEKEGRCQEAIRHAARLEAAAEHWKCQDHEWRERCAEMQHMIEMLQKENVSLKSSLSIFACEMSGLEKQKQENQAWLLSAKEHLEQAFAEMARQVLGKTSTELQHYHEGTVKQLFDPLRNSLQALEKTIQDTYHGGVKERFALGQEIRLLAEKSQQITQEAHALSTALRHNHKIQGSWGEMVLEKILESSGLRRDVDFWVQKSFSGDEAQRLQPDIVLRLPENKHIVIDAKVSLVAFEQYVAERGEGEAGEVALKAHLQAVRQHIKTLSRKSYHEIGVLQTVEFVLLFIPVESAFLLALSEDDQLFLDAWRHHIVLIGPSTLLATLRIVARMLSFQEYHENAQKMMRYATQLYEKAIGFLEEMATLGMRLDGARKAYDQAIQRLKTGRGSLVQQIENIQKLGVTSNKEIPDSLRPVPDVDQCAPLHQEEPSFS